MRNTTAFRWFVLAVANAGLWCMLGFYQTSSAAPQPIAKPPRAIGQPLADSVRLQSEMLGELKAIRRLLEQQNKLLQAGRHVEADGSSTTR